MPLVQRRHQTRRGVLELHRTGALQNDANRPPRNLAPEPAPEPTLGVVVAVVRVRAPVAAVVRPPGIEIAPGTALVDGVLAPRVPLAGRHPGWYHPGALTADILDHWRERAGTRTPLRRIPGLRRTRPRPAAAPPGPPRGRARVQDAAGLDAAEFPGDARERPVRRRGVWSMSAAAARAAGPRVSTCAAPGSAPGEAPVPRIRRRPGTRTGAAGTPEDTPRVRSPPPRSPRAASRRRGGCHP